MTISRVRGATVVRVRATVSKDSRSYKPSFVNRAYILRMRTHGSWQLAGNWDHRPAASQRLISKARHAHSKHQLMLSVPREESVSVIEREMREIV
jgi:hypothetical protein